jgi:transposase
VFDTSAARLEPDELWAIVEPLIPPFVPRRRGGGTAPVEAQAVFTAIVYG